MMNTEKRYEGSGDVWVYAQRSENGTFHPASLEILGAGRRLADETGGRLCAVLPGYEVGEKTAELIACGADLVYLAEHELLRDYSTDAYCKAVSELTERERPDIFLFAGTDQGRDLAPRVAARVRTGLTVDCTELSFDREERELRQIRPAFGSSLMAEIRTGRSRPQMCTVRPGMFKRLLADRSRQGRVVEVPVSLTGGEIRTRILESVTEETGCDLKAAKIVIGGGLGIGGKEGFGLLEQLAKALHGAVGATRAAVNEGWISHERMIGQTGVIIAPDLYIAFGISGAVQHMLGVSGAGCVVAVNNNPQSPIFESADYGIVADYREWIPEFLEEIKKN